MEYIELSLESSKKIINDLAAYVRKVYDYDLVIFIAKGSYTIGDEFAKYNNVPLLRIFATRKGNKIKNFFSPFLKILPNKLSEILRKFEMNSNVHGKKSEREVKFDKEKWSKYKDKKRILLVDDSVDTGNSIILTKNEIQQFFCEADVKVAALNKFKKSEQIVHVDFYKYEDTIIKGPWANDSKEHAEFLKLYEKYIEV